MNVFPRAASRPVALAAATLTLSALACGPVMAAARPAPSPPSTQGRAPVLDSKGNPVLFDHFYTLKDADTGLIGHAVEGQGSPVMRFTSDAKGAAVVRFRGGASDSPVPTRTDVYLYAEISDPGYIGKDGLCGYEYALNNQTTASASNFFVYDSNAAGTRMADHPDVLANSWVTVSNKDSENVYLEHLMQDTGIDHFQFVPAS